MKRIFRSSSSLLIHAFPSSVEIDLKGEPQMKQSRPLTNFIVFAMATSILATAYAGQLRAGAARVSITPTADQFPYIIGREKPFVGTHDDVYARALVLDDGATRVAFVVVEAVSVPDPKHVETDVAQAAGVPESNLILCASHTHESLTTFIHGTNLIPSQLEEIEHVRAGAVEAARQAVAHLEPAAIAFGRGEAYVNINNGEQAGLTSWFDPKGSRRHTTLSVEISLCCKAQPRPKELVARLLSVKPLFDDFHGCPSCVLANRRPESLRSSPSLA